MNPSSRTLIMVSLFLVASLLGMTWLIVRTITDEAEQSRDAVKAAADSMLPDGLGKIIETAADGPRDVAGNAARNGIDVVGELAEKAGSILDEFRGVVGQGSNEKVQSDGDSNRGGSSEPTLNEIDPVAMLGDVFQAGREITHSIDQVMQAIIKLDDAEELETGLQVHRLIRENHRILDDARLTKKIATLAEPFLQSRFRRAIDYKFFVVDDPEINAFSHIGGYVYVNQGLLDFVKNNDSELQFVIGHEISHVDLGHCAEQMTYAARASQVAGEFGQTIVQIGYQAIAIGYSEEKEFEADARSCETATSVRLGAISFLTRLAENSKEEETATKPENIIGVVVNELNNHFRTHPPANERILHIQELDRLN